tara:strand:- start:1046 stop:1492 length:447 start_codon:yes stop_codon:yes gene_type:complete
MIKIKLIKEITDKGQALEEPGDFQQRIRAVMDTWDDTPEGKRHKEDLKSALLAQVQEGEGVPHNCATHLEENFTGWEGRPVNHTLLENGKITHYDIEFDKFIVESVPVESLKVLRLKEHTHKRDIDDYPHDDTKERIKHENLKEWFKK